MSAEGWGVVVSVLGFGATIYTLWRGIKEYRRAEKWKRREFVAAEMKDFFDDPLVQNACSMIDWGGRDIALTLPGDKKPTSVRVSRRMQCDALVPHTLRNPQAGSDRTRDMEAAGPRAERALETAVPDRTGEDEGGGRRSESTFSREEAAIRDCFDAFLDGIERFGSLIECGLASEEELRPYLRYWIKDIGAAARDEEDAAWTAHFLTYLLFYQFAGALRVFSEFGFDIRPDSELLRRFFAGMKDQTRASDLAAEARRGMELMSKSDPVGRPEPLAG